MYLYRTAARLGAQRGPVPDNQAVKVSEEFKRKMQGGALDNVPQS